ncbi:MAG: ABC transporter, partial [Pirellulaceae bacterium]|nr:ABC transporter [Pirellulaceae bacterium]
MSTESQRHLAAHAIPEAYLPLPLATGEVIQATFAPNLDAQRRFHQSLLVLSNQRLMFLQTDRSFESWPLEPTLRLESGVLGGLGKLRLTQHDQPLATWWFTAALNVQIDRFVGVFHSTLRSRDVVADHLEPQTCPSCGFVLSSDDPVCPSCTPVAAPPATRSLRRLLPFARRRGSTIITGLLLTVAATAAGLVPPYLTMPLLDKVLVPMQNGQSVSSGTVGWYLGLLAVAAVAAWLLGWAKTFVLSLASEQVSSDLRVATYQHLQRLSLEFYGGRRTGDLISRISSDTDRLCNFLSMHLVDFITDVLMFIFTSIVLIAIDPMLAAVTLLPFPAIAWLVHEGRSRLRHGFARAT